MLHEPDVIEQFRAAMRERDIHVTSDIIADGKLHRAHVDGDKKGQRNGWYILHIDEKPAGAFGCNRRYGNDQKFTWTGKASKPLTAAERREIRARIEKQKLEREAAEQARHAAAAALARQLWDSAEECKQHPYLTRKQIQSHGLRVGKWEKIDEETGDVRLITKQALLIPIRDTKKQIHSLQAIFPRKLMGDRDKDYLTGGNKAGHFYSIGKPVEFEGRIVIIICEGYATGASLHEATGHAVIVAFDAPNLLLVAQAIRARFPDAIIIMAADNDQWTLKPVNNPGMTRAREAAHAIGGLVAVPPFEHGDGKPDADGKWSGPNDFNDLHLRRGADAVRDIIDGTLAPEPIEEVVDEMPPWEGEEEMMASSGTLSDGGDGDGDDEGDEDGRPETNGHFTVLGYDHGEYFIFQHGKRQISRLTKSDFTEAGLIELAPLNWWEMNFQGDKPGSINKKAAIEFIMRTAEKRGIYDTSRIRGRGAWNDEGRMIFHHGARLSVDGIPTDITKVKSRYVYELDRSLPEPAETALTDEEGQNLLQVAELFRWTKPGSAALLAGFVILAPLCGALRWRPHVWLTGGAGCGKSTVLNEFVHVLMNGMDVFAQGNSSEAGIRQTLQADALPVLFDESESNEERDAVRIQNVLSLIRQASTESQARTLKGTAGGAAMAFHIRSMFCLASIQVAIKHQADVERLTVLALRPKREDTDAAGTWKRISEALHMIKRDPDLPARLFRRSLDLLPVIYQNIAVFAEVAAEKFGSQRDGDQYGTLLAGTWALVSREPVTRAEAEALIDSYDWSEHIENNEVDEAQRAMSALLEAHIRVNGIELTVYELVRCASHEPTEVVDLTPAKANAILERHGMKVKDDRLLLANTSNELKRLLTGSSFEADWRNTLLRVKGADRYNNKSVKFNGAPSKCISLSLKPIIYDDEAAGAEEQF